MMGWIKLQRDIVNSCTWRALKPEHRIVLITVLTQVNFAPATVQVADTEIKLQAGEVFLSTTRIVALCGCKEITTSVVRAALQRLEQLDFLTLTSYRSGYKIAIKNWSRYQGGGSVDAVQEPAEPEPGKAKKVKSKMNAATVAVNNIKTVKRDRGDIFHNEEVPSWLKV